MRMFVELRGGWCISFQMAGNKQCAPNYQTCRNALNMLGNVCCVLTSEGPSVLGFLHPGWLHRSGLVVGETVVVVVVGETVVVVAVKSQIRIRSNYPRKRQTLS